MLSESGYDVTRINHIILKFYNINDKIKKQLNILKLNKEISDLQSKLKISENFILKEYFSDKKELENNLMFNNNKLNYLQKQHSNATLKNIEW